MTENENVESKQENQQSITTDDLIFAIGDKETIILSKNKQIQYLQSQVKILSNRVGQMSKNEDLSGDLQQTKEKLEEVTKEKNDKEAENEELKSKIEKLKEENNRLQNQSKKYYDLQNDNERLSRLLKEKEKKISELKESSNLIDGDYFNNREE